MPERNSLSLVTMVVVAVYATSGCTCDPVYPSDAASGTDATGGTDATPGTDAAGGTDATSTDAAMVSDAGGVCTTDSDCVMGVSWCVAGQCEKCDNSGLLCDIDCSIAIPGWTTYERNGCFPCDCAPTNECDSDADCPSTVDPASCYAGAFCWDWCPPNDPSCCFGNLCSTTGCTPPPPSGCVTRGCPLGQSCNPMSVMPCNPGSCGCDTAGFWTCDASCTGGACM